MASLIQRIKEPEKYFTNNWTDTTIQTQDNNKFENNALTSYIRLNYVNSDNTSTIGRQQGYGTLQVFCYHRNKTMSAVLSDNVKTFFDCQDLGQDVHSKVGVQYETMDLDNDFYLTLVQFPIEQFS